MSSTDTRSGPSSQPLAAGTRPGAVHLTITDLDRSVGFYQDAIGLRVHGREDGTAAMGAGGEDLVVMAEEPGARPAVGHAGLYHFALLHPSREQLADAALRLAATRTPIEGASDHGVSEALYLADPDGNGIELYADRPRERWPSTDGGERIRMFTEPLDVQGLLAAARGTEAAPHADPGLVLGHVHLHVGDLEAAVRFYRDVVGFEVMASIPGAAFVSAGGYHHHLGLNIWRGEGVPPAPTDAVGLRHWTLRLTDRAELERARARADAAGAERAEIGQGLVLRDPSGNAVLLTAP